MSVGSFSKSGVLITEQLYQRPCRPLNLEAEVKILRALGQQLTRPLQVILKYLVEAAVDLCFAGTAGVSLIETQPSGEEVLRWVALAGIYEQYEGDITNREYSPCGICLNQGSTQLYHQPEGYFPSSQQAEPPIVEGLVLPLLLEGQALGTIWIASHNEQRQFDSEDVRVMTSLADFAVAAIHSSRLRQAALETQQALHQTEPQSEPQMLSQMQALITNMPGMVYRYRPCADGHDRLLLINSGCRDLFEVEPETALQDAGSIWSQIYPDDRSSFQASVAAAVENFLPWDWQGRIITSSGEVKWIQGKSSAVKTTDGDVWDGLLMDITDSKQAELVLIEQKKLLELTASAHPLDECLSSLCTSISRLNCRVRASILLANEQRSSFKSFITPDFPPSFAEGLKDAPINELAIGTCGAAVFYGHPVTCPDIANDERWSKEWRDLCVAHGILACHSAPVLGVDGVPLGSLMLCFGSARIPTDWEYQLVEFGTHIASIALERDLAETEREQLLTREKAAREQAESANRLKDEFLAVLSHELRTPLNPILGWTTLLGSGKLDVEKTAYALETIERNVKLQVQLIEDLLDISAILHGKLRFNVKPVDLETVIRASLETVRLAAVAKSVEIKTTISSTVATVSGDEGRLQQVLCNLLSNAVKFTPNGGQVTVTLTIAENHAQIQVTDTGKGINPDFLPYIFEHFRQEDGATTRQFSGLGLGLAIVRQMVEMHGGTVKAESPGVGQGATFTVKLPLLSPLLKNKDYGIPDERTTVSFTSVALPG
ncbi:MAG: GAF domain-containing protein [Scytonematopsis contorta HA4267-MV1]|nr:GAF domain-containing protein [Scytonematopsis contorta HA4267-MV1]